MRNSKQIIDEILNKRGIVSEEEIDEFLTLNPKKTYDPFLLDEMQAGVDLLISEAAAGTKICIYGDYDADGVTSVCVLSRGIRELTDNWFYYIPSRFEEGYGLNVGAIDKIRDRGAGLIVTVDCGCVSYKEVEHAKSLGLRVIVTDHHNIEDTIADCIVINPKKPEKFLKDNETVYPFPDLAGCGVAFKFLQALQRKKQLPKSILNDALDMVAIGTVGDIVSLRDENRTLVKYGIAVANSGRRKSLRKLAETISLKDINSENIAFAIVPHINATGRMASAAEAVNLFLSESETVIEQQIEKLVSCNRERKTIQEKAYESCLNMIDGDEYFIVIRPENIHEGIAGIVAGKIKDRFNRPVIILTPAEEGYYKGTGRSMPEINLYNVLNEHGELFERFGGHKGACGFLMKEENLDKLIEGVNDEVRKLHSMNPNIFEADIDVDSLIEPDEVSVELARELQKLSPFGEGNPSPKFLIEGVEISSLSYMGENSTHARFNVKGKSATLKCVLFRRAQDMSDLLESESEVDVIGSVSHQVWRGQERVQFIVEEIRKCRLAKQDS